MNPIMMQMMVKVRQTELYREAEKQGVRMYGQLENPGKLPDKSAVAMALSVLIGFLIVGLGFLIVWLVVAV